MKLTTIKNLLGRQGGHFLLFGLLTRMEDGEFYLEDLDDKVKLNLDAAVRLALSLLPFSQSELTLFGTCRHPNPVSSLKAPSSLLTATTRTTRCSRWQRLDTLRAKDEMRQCAFFGSFLRSSSLATPREHD
jgi:hypothetical protein